MTFENAKVAIFNNKRSKQLFYQLNSNYGRTFSQSPTLVESFT